MSVYLTGHGRKKTAIELGSEHNIFEHRKVTLEGLEPNSSIEVRLAGTTMWTPNAQANSYGRCEDILEEADLHSRPDEYELRCQTLEGELVFSLKLDSGLRDEQIRQMIFDLANPELRLDIESKIATRVPTLEKDIETFCRLWLELAELVSQIEQSPGESLEPVQSLVPTSSAKQLKPADILRNLLEHRLVRKDGITRTQKLIWAETLSPTADTAENAYIVSVIERFGHKKDNLLRQLGDEQKRFSNQKAQEEKFGLKTEAYNALSRKLNHLNTYLEELPKLTVPEGWNSFKSIPSRATNRARYDPRYQQVARLEDQLEEENIDPRDTLGRETALNRFGKRRTWQLYEYWVFRSVYTCLRDLNFEDETEPSAQNAEPVKGFRKFENINGGEYGLRENAHLVLRHRDVPELKIKLTFQPSWLDEDGSKLVPDMSLELLGTNYPQARKLFLDAKCIKLGRNTSYMQEYLEDSARRYRDSYGKEAMAFLVNREAQLWPNMNEKDKNLLSPDDQDFRIGVVRLEPCNQAGVTQLQRLLTAWLYSSSHIAICTRCGEGLKPENTEESGKPKPPNFQRPAQTGHSFRCKTCGTGVTLNHCGGCGKEKLIFKIYPRGRTEANRASNQQREICELSPHSYQMRICPKCGNSGYQR